MNFVIPCFRFPKIDFLSYFEYFLHRLQGHKICSNRSFNEVIQSCRNVIGKLPRLFKYTFKLITKSDVEILKRLEENDDIVICRPDKGNGAILLDRKNYLEKMNNILTDRSK